ncbi:kinase-like protein [Thozetella sp. PMI_491]|nr:kinase-like protein [Thozetella sp. PMI_491]
MEEEERRLQEQRGPQVKPLPCRYRTGKTIGDSTYSILKECRHIESGRYFVTQLYRKDDLTGQEYKMRTAIKVLKSVSQGNKNIVTLEDYFETLQNLYLVLEYYSGETLFDKIERLGYIDESTAAHIIANILDGTIYLHSLGIAHRNLKAANIVFKTNINETDIRIGDFFDAMYVDDETAVFQEVGSPQYKAPEVVEERPHGTPCDIWSIGVITYFTLTGRRPFDHAEDADLDQAIVSGGYSFTPEEEWKNIHPSAKDFINRCLIFDPVERITAQEARKHKWMRHWDLWPVVAQPDGNNGGDGIADTESSEDDEVEIEGDEAIATESMDVSDLPTPDPEEDKIRVEEDERGAAEKQEDETVATDSPDAGDVAMPDPDSDSPEHV